jgi:hypothetical protein
MSFSTSRATSSTALSSSLCLLHRGKTGRTSALLPTCARIAFIHISVDSRALSTPLVQSTTSTYTAPLVRNKSCTAKYSTCPPKSHSDRTLRSSITLKSSSCGTNDDKLVAAGARTLDADTCIAGAIVSETPTVDASLLVAATDTLFVGATMRASPLLLLPARSGFLVPLEIDDMCDTLSAPDAANINDRANAGPCSFMCSDVFVSSRSIHRVVDATVKLVTSTLDTSAVSVDVCFASNACTPPNRRRICVLPTPLSPKRITLTRLFSISPSSFAADAAANSGVASSK